MKTALVGAIVVVLTALPLGLEPSQVRLLTEVLYLSLFALSFNFLYNTLGLLSFGHNLGFGFGAYAVALYFQEVPDGSIGLAIAMAVMVAMAVSAVAGAAAVRLKGGYFALMTMATCQLAYFLAGKWRTLTHGEDGIMIAAPTLSLPGVDVSPAITLYWLALLVLCAGAGALAWYLATPLGRATRLLKENDARAPFLGYNVVAVKLAAFALAGTLAGAAGAVFALFQGLVSPVVLGFGLSGDVIMMTLLGGSGSLFGPAAGAAIYTGLEDLLPRWTGHPRLFLAALFVVVVLFVPYGLAGVATKVTARIKRWSDPSQQSSEMRP